MLLTYLCSWFIAWQIGVRFQTHYPRLWSSTPLGLVGRLAKAEACLLEWKLLDLQLYLLLSRFVPSLSSLSLITAEARTWSVDPSSFLSSLVQTFQWLQTHPSTLDWCTFRTLFWIRYMRSWGTVSLHPSIVQCSTPCIPTAVRMRWSNRWRAAW